jgi:hypothetical protein
MMGSSAGSAPVIRDEGSKMTQNKKFKKLVRARMAKTGETYMQARHALDDGRQTVTKPTTYKALGFWKSLEERKWPDPLNSVDASWDPEERAKVIAYLESGHVAQVYFGKSWCRLGCEHKQRRADGKVRNFFEAYGGSEQSWEERLKTRKLAVQQSEDANMKGDEVRVDMGSIERTDGIYVWPEGLTHYVKEHNVRLPQEFVDHVLREGSLEPREKQELHKYEIDGSWWLRSTNLKDLLTKPTELDELRKRLRRTWHKVYNGKTLLFHVYEDGPEDGRVHTSLCGAATTKRVSETKTPGAPDCEKCKLLKVKEILNRQKAIGDPFNILHDPELWAATGGTEEERIAQRNELWGEPPESPPRVVDVEMPFNKGWYFYDAEYPDEGSQGPYMDLADATQAAKLAGYDPLDEGSVGFIEQTAPTAVVQRYVADHITRDLQKKIEAEPPGTPAQFRQHFSRVLGQRLSAVVGKLQKEKVLVPSESDFELRVPPATEEDQTNGIFRASVVIKNPERYPEFVRDLTEMGLIEPKHMISVKMKEAN